MSWSLQKKKQIFFGLLILSEENFFKICVYLNVQCIEYTFRIYIHLHIKKALPHIVFCLFLKSSKAFSESLSVADLAGLVIRENEIEQENATHVNNCDQIQMLKFICLSLFTYYLLKLYLPLVHKIAFANKFQLCHKVK